MNIRETTSLLNLCWSDELLHQAADSGLLPLPLESFLSLTPFTRLLYILEHSGPPNEGVFDWNDSRIRADHAFWHSQSQFNMHDDIDGLGVVSKIGCFDLL